MTSRWPFYLTLLTSCIVAFIDGTTFVITAPKQIYYDTQYTVAVSAHGVNSKDMGIVQVYYRAQPSRQILHTEELLFTKDEIKSFGYVFNSARLANVQSVWLEVFSGYKLNGQIKELHFSENQGYIFIQTDKPLYTPGQKVKFRIIALDEYERFAQHPLKVEIKNPDSVLVDRFHYLPKEAFKSREIELPRETTLGNWTISANYEGLGKKLGEVFSRTFEVREYVLPRFTTMVKIKPRIITNETKRLTVTVSSKYVFGKIVKGIATVQLDLPDMPLGIIQSKELKKGKLEARFDLINMNMIGLISEEKQRLIVNVTVTEGGTLETDNVLDDSTIMVNPFHTVSYGGSKKRFKPGFNYTLHAQVKDATGSPALESSVLTLIVTFENSEGDTIDVFRQELTPDSIQGNVRSTFKTHQHSVNMTVKLSMSKEPSKRWPIYNNEITVQMQKTVDKQYLQIALQTPVTKTSDGSLRLQYTRSETLGNINVIVLARGKLIQQMSIKKEPEGEAFAKISRWSYEAGLPFMRIIAYYDYVQEKKNEKIFITDSIKLETKEECKKEISIVARPKQLEPKDRLRMRVKGDENMSIGLVAVDKAILALSEDEGLTRKVLFDQLMSHDPVRNFKGKMNSESDVENSGIFRIILVTESSKSKHDHRVALKLSHSSHRHHNPLSEHISPHDFAEDEIPSAVLDPGVFESVPPPVRELEKPKSVRRYFPESWLFEEYDLNSDGKLMLNLNLPDSITTWSFMAVGVSATGGVCVSKPFEQEVWKLLFVEIQLPYKVTRLELFKAKIIVSNHLSYEVQVKVSVRGSEDLCFVSKKGTKAAQNARNFKVNLKKYSSKSHTIQMVPLHNGQPNLTVDVSTASYRDTIEKKVYVVPEGQRMRKTLTFVLDPKAQYASFARKNKNKITLAHTKTLKDTIIRKRKQHTRINLVMPQEYIRGTESCRISAFGNIMGDIIDYAINKSKSLMDLALRDAEEVIGDMGPTVHALLYANKSGLMSKDLKVKAQNFIRGSILRLLRYRDNHAFRLTPKSPDATWLTSVVMKSLCHASPLSFIDKETLIGQGFEWLMEQMDENGSFQERDWRLAKDTQDYKIMLSAEALIAAKECAGEFSTNEMLKIQGSTVTYLKKHLEKITDVMVLAKVAYALTLFDKGEVEELKEARNARIRLSSMMRRNRKGHNYWSYEPETNEKPKVPFWYHKGARASSIEATAFALLVYLQHEDQNVDAIADWLITQRNHQGVFVGALDSMAAIQALSAYGAKKHRQHVDLSLEIKANKTKDFAHSFKFTEENAIHPKSLSNVPVGDVIDVITRGQGLGQMHVNVEYNVPIDDNARCRYNVSVQIKQADFNLDPKLMGHPLCQYCNANCPKPEPAVPEVPIPPIFNETNNTDSELALNRTINNTQVSNVSADNVNRNFFLQDDHFPLNLYLNDEPIPLPPINPASGKRLMETKKILAMEKKYQQRLNKRKKRSKRGHNFSKSRTVWCIQVCVEYLGETPVETTEVVIEMLTGYDPLDIEKLEENEGITSAFYDDEQKSIALRFKQMPEGNNCFSFRVLQGDVVRKQRPAIIYIREISDPAPSCLIEYSAPRGKSLLAFCASKSKKNRGECKCFSGLCSTCKPTIKNEISLTDAKKLVCKADVGYQVLIKYISKNDAWAEYKADIVSMNKTSKNFIPGKSVVLSSPSACSCPNNYALRRKPVYLLTSDVEKIIDHRGKTLYRYLLDERSTFVSVKSPNSSDNPRYAQTPYFIMMGAFASKDQCERD